jgi:ATP-dependent helicase HrpB
VPETALPIWEIETPITNALRADHRLLLSAPTGSGKTTQVPQILLRNGLLEKGQVVILQPRRLAARLLAARVAQELGVTLGREVGYQIRFENVTSPATRIRFVTEGVLLRQMISEPQLDGIAVLIFDEFHERHLYGDITLAQALELQERRRADLKLVVMSATLDTDLLTPYLSQVGPDRHQESGGRVGTAAADGTVPAAPGKGRFVCSVLSSEGRTFPVDIRYLAQPSYLDKRPVWDQAAEAFSRYVAAGGQGDVLVFMPGGFEIAQTLEAIRHTDEARGFILLPLHGDLPPREQDAAVARYRQRKVVVATNVAETSLTIDGVRFVIDSGLARLPRHDPYRGINTLLVEKISRASADQRAGRAGRTAAGACLRLWSREEHSQRPEQELPEVKRLDLAEVVLTLKAAGVEDLRTFRWLERPEDRSLAHAEELLLDLGALDRPVDAGGQAPAPGETRAAERPSEDTRREAGTSRTEITALGRRMLAFPIHPRYARMLLAAQEHGCVYQAALVAALTQGRDLLLRNVDRITAQTREEMLGEKASSDFWILMRAWSYAAGHEFRVEACRKLGIHAVTARQVGPLLDHFLRLAKREGLETRLREVRDEALQKCVLIAFSDRVAHRLDQGTLRCELVHGRRGVLARESAVQHSPLFVAAEVREIEGKDKEVNTILSLATAIEVDWLRQLFPQDLQTEERVSFDSAVKRVMAAELLRFRGLALSAKRVEPPPAAAAARLLADEIVAGRLLLKRWDHSIEQWILRLNRLAQWCPELALPRLNEEDQRHLIEQLCHGAFSYKEIKDREVRPVVTSWLSAAQQELLDRHAPERLSLTNGRTPKVSYDAANLPYIALRIQELYDVTQTPRIAMGRVAVLVHILSPGMKPVQVTQDLAGFWREQYPRLKSELQRRYPKHEWR